MMGAMRTAWALEDYEGERSSRSSLATVQKAARICAQFRRQPIKIVQLTRGKYRAWQGRVVCIQYPDGRVKVC